MGAASGRESDARSGLRTSINPQMKLYSFIGVGLGRELSIFEILGLARFWSYDPSLGGYDPFIGGSLVRGCNCDPRLRGSLHKGVMTPCKGVATEKLMWILKKNR